MMKVSIIVPVYNAERFIENCIKSVANQTMQDGVECLLIDDCSTDNSVAKIKNVISLYQGVLKFKLLRQARNQGPSAARNLGINEASGKYVFFLDSDDSISTDCVSQLYLLANKYAADYVQGTYSSDEHYRMPFYGKKSDAPLFHGNIIGLPEFSNDRKYIKQTLLNYNMIPFTPHNRLVRRDLLVKNNLYFNQKICVREDFYWMFFMAKVVSRLAVCKNITYFRGFNESSLTHEIQIEREINGSKTLIEDFSKSLDPFMLGSQKELLLETLLMTLRAHYYHDEKERVHLINTVLQTNTVMETWLLRIVLVFSECKLRNKLLHLLIRLYKLYDK